MTDKKQSRVGKRPVPVPAGVSISIDGDIIKAKGPKGEASRTLRSEVTVAQQGAELIVGIADGAGRHGTQYQGLTRSLLANMVKGVHEGFTRSLDLRGVGYRAAEKNGNLDMALGLSHGVSLPIPEGVKVKISQVDETGMKFPRVLLESHDNELVGLFAARIRSKRPAEPYQGKGIRYTGEQITMKAGKSGAK